MKKILSVHCARAKVCVVLGADCIGLFIRKRLAWPPHVLETMAWTFFLRFPGSESLDRYQTAR
jgi:hypothetical protein